MFDHSGADSLYTITKAMWDQFSPGIATQMFHKSTPPIQLIRVISYNML